VPLALTEIYYFYLPGYYTKTTRAINPGGFVLPIFIAQLWVI
jgi:type IV secretory pathway component VirB8